MQYTFSTSPTTKVYVLKPYIKYINIIKYGWTLTEKTKKNLEKRFFRNLFKEDTWIALQIVNTYVY